MRINIKKRYRKYEDGGEVDNQQADELVEQEDDVKVEEKSMFDKILDFVTGSDIPRSMSQYLKKHGDKKIVSIDIARAPIQKTVGILMNLITNGLFDKVKNKIGIDSFFHLYLIIGLDDGKKLRLEKNQNLKISDYRADKDEESLSVDLRSKQLTLNEMFDNTYSKYGRNRVNIYNALSTNCQRFVSDFLQANGLLTQKAKKFILQSVKELIDELPESAKKTSKKITDAASYLNKILEFVSNGYLRLKRGGKVK